MRKTRNQRIEIEKEIDFCNKVSYTKLQSYQELKFKLQS